jgi:hypothetical protein
MRSHSKAPGPARCGRQPVQAASGRQADKDARVTSAEGQHAQLGSTAGANLGTRGRDVCWETDRSPAGGTDRNLSYKPVSRASIGIYQHNGIFPSPDGSQPSCADGPLCSASCRSLRQQASAASAPIRSLNGRMPHRIAIAAGPRKATNPDGKRAHVGPCSSRGQGLDKTVDPLVEGTQ